MLLSNTTDAIVSKNQIRFVGRGAPDALIRAGVFAGGVLMLRVQSNTILEVGADPFAGLGVGVAAAGAFERVDVVDNTIRRARTNPGEQAAESAWEAIVIIGGTPIEGDDGGTGFVPAPINHFAAVGKRGTFAFQAAAGRILALGTEPGSVGVRGNVADAFGRSPAITVFTAGAMVIGENRVTLDAPGDSVSAVALLGSSAVVSANHVSQPRGQRSIQLALNPQGAPFTMLGNVTSGPIVVDGAGLGAPWDALNA